MGNRLVFDWGGDILTFEFARGADGSIRLEPFRRCTRATRWCGPAPGGVSARPCATSPDIAVRSCEPGAGTSETRASLHLRSTRVPASVERLDAIGEPGESTAVAEYGAPDTVVGDLDVQPVARSLIITALEA